MGENQDKYISQVNLTLQQFHSNLSDEINNLVKNNDNNSVKQFITSFDSKLSTMFQTVQQPVFSFLTASEERIQSNIQIIKDNTLTTQSKNAATMDELSLYLKKFNNSSFKGALGEAELETVLTQMFPSGEVVNTSCTKASCDFLLRRSNKPNIMLENKVYHRNVDPLEVDKFIRDVDEMKTNAIFLSQHSGISRKNNFHPLSTNLFKEFLFWRISIVLD